MWHVQCPNKVEPPPEPCPSWPLPDGGYLYRGTDIVDPLATVGICNCSGDVDLFGYPTPAPSHSVALLDFEGNIIAYAANNSSCSVPGDRLPLIIPIVVPCDTPPPTPCPSWVLPDGGFLFRATDVIDPAATTGICNCSGAVDLYGYPSSGAGHTIPVYDFSGAVVVYASDTSTCGVPPATIN